MNRRRFLRISGGGLAIATGGLAGCLGSDDGNDPPPREAEVFDDISFADGTMEISLLSDPKVESTVDNVDEAAVVGSLLPVGTARAGSRSSGSGSGPSGATGRGTTSGYSDAPRGRHGWAVYGGHHGSSHDDYEDETETHRAAVAALGVAYVGSNSEYKVESPGPGPVSWAEKWTDLDPGATLEVDLATLSSDLERDADAEVGNETDDDSAAPSGNETELDAGSASLPPADEGWYRVGTLLESPDGSIDFGWQAADFRLERGSSDELTVEEAWHVRPQP